MIGDWQKHTKKDYFSIEFDLDNEGEIFGFYDDYEGVDFEYGIEGNIITMENDDGYNEEIEFNLKNIDSLGVIIKSKEYLLTRKKYN